MRTRSQTRNTSSDQGRLDEEPIVSLNSSNVKEAESNRLSESSGIIGGLGDNSTTNISANSQTGKRTGNRSSSGSSGITPSTKNRTPPSTVKQKTRRRGKGRRKIEIKFIEQKSKRQITFSKRKSGLMKKAYELSTLTGSEMLVLVTSETGHVYTFATRKFQPMITMSEGKNLIQTLLSCQYGMGEESEMSIPNQRLSGLNITPSSSRRGSKAMVERTTPPPPPPVQVQVNNNEVIENQVQGDQEGLDLRNRIFDFQNSIDVSQQQQFFQQLHQMQYGSVGNQQFYQNSPPPPIPGNVNLLRESVPPPNALPPPPNSLPPPHLPPNLHQPPLVIDHSRIKTPPLQQQPESHRVEKEEEIRNLNI